MRSNILIGVLVLVVVGIIGFMIRQNSSSNIAEEVVNSTNGIVATVYKSPSCSCCEQYSAYLRKKGYGVEVEAVSDLQSIKEQFSIPYELESCHTMEIDGYVVEGHVPEEAVQKLLAERPDIKGIGMAGMPSGSPGMPGPKTEDFVIYEITHEGIKGEVFMII
ncbi:CopG family transcriptional regulator [Candidatus Nomurabacteria bacterium]|nr:CopG family transcriptional regulator [Candidatus Nomurabacteria bacterium]